MQLKNQLLWAWVSPISFSSYEIQLANRSLTLQRSCERFDLGKGEETSTKADGMVQKGHDEVREMEEDGL